MRLFSLEFASDEDGELISHECSISIYLFLFVQRAQKHNVAITYSGQDSETTMVLNTALNT